MTNEQIIRKEAHAVLLDARTTLERAIREIDGYIDQLEHAEDDGRRARVLNRAINYLAANLISSLRFDRMADQQAELARLAE